MTKQEIIDLVDKYTGICDIVFSEELADALIPRIEQEKYDTLKAFVGWVIGVYTKEAMSYRAGATNLNSDDETREYCSQRYGLYMSQCEGLKVALEQFIKERKK